MRDRDFVESFEACTLPPNQFPHRAHVRLAWLYLREDSLLDALTRFVEGLKRYAGSLGASTKYHETITWAYLFLIHERMARESFATFDEFAAANEDLFNGILEKYYRKETLASDLARRTFVMPDGNAGRGFSHTGPSPRFRARFHEHRRLRRARRFHPEIT